MPIIPAPKMTVSRFGGVVVIWCGGFGGLCKRFRRDRYGLDVDFVIQWRDNGGTMEDFGGRYWRCVTKLCIGGVDCVG